MIKKIFQKLLANIFPQSCISCNSTISEDGTFCHNCWNKLKFITKPHCSCCSFPFEVEIKNMSPLCGKCLKKKPFFDRTIAIFRFEPRIGKAIGDLKYRDQTFLAKKFAAILAKNAASEIADCDIVAAVPLHLNRLRQRKFNQALLIAKEIAPKKLICDLLWKVADKEPQVKLTQKQRQANLARAFLVNKSFRKAVKGKKILLIDDVMTTGTTLNSCAKELKRRGASEVICLVIAKTIFG